MTDEKVIVRSGNIARVDEGTQSKHSENDRWSSKTVRVRISSEVHGKRLSSINSRLRGIPSRAFDTSK